MWQVLSNIRYLDRSGISTDAFLKRWVCSLHLKMIKDAEGLISTRSKSTKALFYEGPLGEGGSRWDTLPTQDFTRHVLGFIGQHQDSKPDVSKHKEPVEGVQEQSDIFSFWVQLDKINTKSNVPELSLPYGLSLHSINSRFVLRLWSDTVHCWAMITDHSRSAGFLQEAPAK